MNLPPPLSPLATLRWSVVRSVLDQLAPRRVLEIGCGLGGFGARMATRGVYVGVEPDDQSYRIARNRVEPAGGRVVHGTLDLIDRADRFDLVCAFEVLEHIEDDRGALADWVGRVAPGGDIVLSVPAWPDRFGPSDHRAGHYRRYRPDQIDAVLRDAGCGPVRHILYGWPLGFVTEGVRNWIVRDRRHAGGETMEDRTAGSGRLFQPRRTMSGLALRVGTAPFVELQKLRPTTGIGLVAIGHRPI